MGINYVNLDETTRKFALEEAQRGGHYVSPRLNYNGRNNWVALLNEALGKFSDDWLATELLRQACFNHRENYTRSYQDTFLSRIIH